MDLMCRLRFKYSGCSMSSYVSLQCPCLINPSAEAFSLTHRWYESIRHAVVCRPVDICSAQQSIFVGLSEKNFCVPLLEDARCNAEKCKNKSRQSNFPHKYSVSNKSFLTSTIFFPVSFFFCTWTWRHMSWATRWHVSWCQYPFFSSLFHQKPWTLTSERAAEMDPPSGGYCSAPDLCFYLFKENEDKNWQKKKIHKNEQYTLRLFCFK